MNQDELNRVAGYGRAQRRRRIWKRFVSGVACVVVFCTVYSLILPALTLEEGAYCGLEEHQHDDTCYENILVCGHEEGETQMVPAHEHTEGCYTSAQTLVCELAESEGHVHTDECISSQQVLICESTDPEHVHEDACYETQETNVCGLAEGDGAHTHTDECYGEVSELTCDLDTAEVPQEHIHSDGCYESTLVCEKEEHTHSLECYSDPDADVESADVWARSVSGAALTGVWSDDVIAIAKTQLGYQESQRNYQVQDDGVTVKGYTRYGAWYGEPYGDWSAMFVSFCLSYAGIPQSAVPQESGCSRYVQQLTQKGLFRASGYQPKKGDLAFFDMDGDGSSDRVGLISSVTADESGHITQFATIEGDSANRVQRGSYTPSQSVVSGFASLPENPSAPTVPETTVETTAETTEATTPKTTEETTPETTGETVPETTVETVPETTTETLPQENIKETMGGTLALPSEGPTAELQAVEDAIDGLEVGTEMGVEVDGTNIVYLRFVPTVTHRYTFESNAGADTYGYLYDADMHEITHDDDSGSVNNFKINYNLTAGTTYYFGVRYYSSGNSGTIPVMLTMTNHVYKTNDAGEFVCECGAKADTADLTLNEQTDVQVTGQNMVYFPYTPEVTHEYTFEVTPTASMYAYLCDQNFNSLTSSSGYNPKITYNLTAGTTYYFGIRYNNDTSSGTVPVLLTWGKHTYKKGESGEIVCDCGVKSPIVDGLRLDTQLDVPASGSNTVFLPYTPEVTHSFVFEVESDANVVVRLYNPDLKNLASNSGSKAKIPYTLTAGMTYYFGIQYNSANDSGNVPVLLSFDSVHKYKVGESGEIICDCGKLASVVNLKLDEQAEISVTGKGMVYLSFTPALDHQFTLSVNPTVAMYTYYYDRNLKQTDYSYTYANRDNKLSRSMTAETPYYYGIVCNSSNGSGTASVVLSLGNHTYLKNEDGIYICNCGESAPTSGVCGDAAYWSYNYADGVLTISGSGKMYDFTEKSKPWNVFKDDIRSVVIEPGVSSIGNYAFYGCKATASISVPDGVTSIGAFAFDGCTTLKNVTIPDSVTYLGAYAFYDCDALTEIAVPGGVQSIPVGAFGGCDRLTKVTILEGVTSIGSSAFASCSKLSEVIFPESLTRIGDSAFSYCYELTSARIPDGVTTLGEKAFYNCQGMMEIYIPKSIVSIGEKAFYNLSSLKTLRWNALGPVDFAKQVRDDFGEVWGRFVYFTVVVGQEADMLTGSSFTQLVNAGADALKFQGPNYITLSALDAPFTGMPLSTLPESRYYIDDSGVIYRLDEASRQAYVAYCPAGMDSFTVPTSIPGENEGAEVPVVGVDTYAFLQATVSQLTFDAPENITVLSDFAFYGARNLASINEKTVSGDVLDVLNLAKCGTQLFAYTKISENGITDQSLVTENEGIKLTISTAQGEKHKPALSSDGAFLYYTGEAAQTTITVSNPQNGEATDCVVRVYFRFDSSMGSTNYIPGHYSVISEKTQHEYSMDVFETTTPNCYCMEIERPIEGDTLSIRIESIYPSPASAGGSVTVWGGVLTAEEKANFGKGLIPIGSSQLLCWETVADEFTVKKTGGNCQLLSDGNGGGAINNLYYEISMSRQGNTVEGVGKDYITYVNFVDTFTLPEGAVFSDEVVNAIREKSYTYHAFTSTWYGDGLYYCLPGSGKTFLTFYCSPGFIRGSMSVVGDNQLIICWATANNDLETEIPRVSARIEIENNVVLIPDPVPDRKYELTNHVQATLHYMHSEDRIKEDSVSRQVSASKGFLTLSKNRNPSSVNWGEPIQYTITATNRGVLEYDQLATLTDPLPNSLYLTAGQIEDLFADDLERDLTIGINSATLCALGEKKAVTAIDGKTPVTTTLQNSGSDVSYSGMSNADSKGCLIKKDATIKLCWADDGQNLKITVAGNDPVLCNPAADDIQQVLDSFGYIVTSDCQYSLSWNCRDEAGVPRPMAGGEKVQKVFYATVKDSFMRLNQDQKYAYPSSSNGISNYVYAYDQFDTRQYTDQVYANSYRDFSLSKSWSKEGDVVTQDSKLEQGSILDYTVSISHKGLGSYEALPLVDHMSGAQALLASVELNREMEWAKSCPTVTVEGKEYYLLCQPDVNYSHVWTSESQMADSVTVTKSKLGFDTVIKWYFADYSGTRSDTVAYKAMVCPAQAVPGALAYSVGNETWLNDHQSHRLYNLITGWYGISFDFDKQIVKEVGDTAPGASYSPLHEGDTVIYRLSLHSARDKDGNPLPLILTGDDLYDALPGSIGSHRWTKDNVTLTYGEGFSNKINEEHWNITDPESDQQYIRWNSDVSLSFTGTAYIYVKLTYPEEIAWQEYVNRYGAETLINTFHVLNRDRSVTHALAIPGCARLQKGVYASGELQTSSDGKTVSVPMNGQQNARFHYSNDGAKKYAVQYYVTLYNGGITKLYLSEIWDRLPKGFTLCDRGSFDGSLATVNNADGSLAEKRRVAYICERETAEDGTQLLRFALKTPSTPGSTDVRYDSTRGMYYLNPGEYVEFDYICYTNKKPDTDPLSINTISMPYYDFTGAGVSVDTGSNTVVKDAGGYIPNDGGCVLENNGQALNRGFTGGSSSTQWLTSEVTVIRGEIKPGITKVLTSSTHNNQVIPDPVSVHSLDLLTWTVTAENDGADRIEDYTLTDVMQAPYMFTGTANYTIYGAGSSHTSVRFTIQNTDDSDVLNIRYYDGYNNYHTLPLTIGGDGVQFLNGVRVAISRDEDQNAVLSIRFKGDAYSIPGGGKGVLTLSTQNTAGLVVNKQFLNTCFITPMAQFWDGTTNKGNVTELETPFVEGALPSVRNSAPVTTTYGYSTSSVKRVTEIGGEADTATSGNDPNFIVLGNSKSLFRYTLSVINSTPKAMDKLILIDSLPELGDHTVFLKSDPRFSAFKVSLAENPNFTLTVTDNETGASTTLDPEKYCVEYSTKTEFIKEDWDGTGTWPATAASEARSIRIVVNDPSGTLIPKESTVSVTFDCKVDDEVDPGDFAWNSFGYHYRLLDDPAELEAAPLKVGVKIPSIPQLRKQLVDRAGQPIVAKETKTFSFLLYQGQPLEGCETAYEMEAKLTEASTPFRKFDLTVPEGQSVSETIFLKSEGWEWENGKYYTLAEYPTSEDYSFRGFDVTGKNTITFLYNKAEDKVITCQNTSLRWSVELTKTDATGESLLPGAVFALYSPNKADKAEPPAGSKAEPQIDRGGATWYFVSQETTNADGKITWFGLLEESYWLLELQAPPGYNLPTGDGWLLESKNETQGIYATTIINTTGHELPQSGGPGTHLYTMGGALLTAAAALLLYKKKKRGKEDPASS